MIESRSKIIQSKDVMTMASDQVLDFQPLNVIDAPPPNTPIRRLFRLFYRVDGQGNLRCLFRIFSFIPFWPIAFISLFHVTYFYKYVVAGLSESLRQPVGIGYLLSYLLCASNLFVTYFTNPGALPWSWSLTQKKVYTSSELCNGVATTIEQFDWALNHDSPPRAHF